MTIGFVKDAMHHIDVQGFNVYHKNRLIKVDTYMESSYVYFIYSLLLRFSTPLIRISGNKICLRADSKLLRAYLSLVFTNEALSMSINQFETMVMVI